MEEISTPFTVPARGWIRASFGWRFAASLAEVYANLAKADLSVRDTSDGHTVSIVFRADDADAKSSPEESDSGRLPVHS